MSRIETVKRHDYADYLNLGSESETNFQLMGTGFTKLDEEFGSQTETSKYVNEPTSTTEVVSYESSFPFDADQIKNQEVIDALYTVGRNHLTGEDAEFEYIRVELWMPTGTSNEFEARLFTVSAEISTISGDSRQVMSGTLYTVGDPTLGTFNTSTRKFTEST